MNLLPPSSSSISKELYSFNFFPQSNGFVPGDADRSYGDLNQQRCVPYPARYGMLHTFLHHGCYDVL